MKHPEAKQLSDCIVLDIRLILTLNINMPVSCGTCEICGICKTKAGQDHAGVCTMIYLPLFSGHAARIRTPEMSQQFAPFHKNSYRSVYF